MAPTLRIALVQFQAKPLCVSENFQRAASEIRSAAAQGNHIVVLPEYHLTSWAPEDPTFADSCAASATYLHQYQELARVLNIHIVPGTIVEPVVIHTSDTITVEQNVKPGDPIVELHNITYFISATTGEILATYRKKNLWHVERGILTADKKSPHKAFDVPFPGSSHVVRVGLLICWDLAFPEALRQLVADGAKLVIIPAYWHINKVNPRLLALSPDSEAVFLDSVTVARAVVDLDTLEVAESHYKVREDISSKGWHY
ncbi:hypothetical protein MKX07_006073 [Trichoderma sp. CBMAI-0711]|nr:hypothetical protein MKX07_006073 [Trichoderma sp. CBMAI-0711]